MNTETDCDFCKAGRAAVVVLIAAFIFWKGKK